MCSESCCSIKHVVVVVVFSSASFWLIVLNIIWCQKRWTTMTSFWVQFISTSAIRWTDLIGVGDLNAFARPCERRGRKPDQQFDLRHGQPSRWYPQLFQFINNPTGTVPPCEEKGSRHFVVHRNVIFQCAKFNRRPQEGGEIVDNFVTALHALAEHCAFGTLHDELIGDLIVVGLLDSKLVGKLQLDPELTLTKAMHQARQSEAVKRHQTLMKNNVRTLHFEINAVNFRTRWQDDFI